MRGGGRNQSSDQVGCRGKPVDRPDGLWGDENSGQTRLKEVDSFILLGMLVQWWHCSMYMSIGLLVSF